MEKTVLIISVLCGATLLIAASISDIKTKKIPNMYTVPAYLIGLALAYTISLREMGLRFVGSAIFFVIFAVIIQAMGAGDVKLCMALITICGIKPAMITLLIAAVLMILCGVIKNRKNAISKIKNGAVALQTHSTKQIKETSERIPFAPYLLAGYLITSAGRAVLWLSV